VNPGRHSRLAALLLSASIPALADSWSGALVDSKCYAGEQRNDASAFVDRDIGLEMRYCSPNPKKSKSFSVVQNDGISFRLDPAGNGKAAALVRATGKMKYFMVVVTGKMSGGTVAVESIDLAK
jgi:hypothetical protein